MQLLMKENTVSTVTNRLVVIFRIIVILLTCIILHFRSPSVSEVKLFMEHNRRGENKFCKMFLIVIIIRRTEGRLLPFSFFLLFSLHAVIIKFWSGAVGSQGVLVWLVFIQMLLDNASSVASSKLLIYFYVEGSNFISRKLQFTSMCTHEFLPNPE